MADMPPPDASQFTVRQVCEELERRSLKPTGFLGEDIRSLQAVLTEEWGVEQQERQAALEDSARRRAEEEVEVARQRFLDAQREREDEAVESDPMLVALVASLRQGEAPPSLTLRISSLATRAIAKALQTSPCSSLRSLDLCGCRIEDDAGIELGKALEGGLQLVRLELDYNCLGPASLAALAAGISTQANQLALLSLERNPLTRQVSPSEGMGSGAPTGNNNNNSTAATVQKRSAAATIAAAAAAGGSDLSGLQALATALASPHCRLRHLNLFATGPGPAGGSILARAIGGSAIRSGSAGHRGGEHGQSRQQQAASQLQQLQLSPHDGVTDADQATIADALARNTIAFCAAETAKAAVAAVDAANAKAAAATSATTLATQKEAAWIAEQAAQRAAVRRELEYAAWKEERKEELAREMAHKDRVARLKAEAEAAAAKKAAAADASKKGAKKGGK